MASKDFKRYPIALEEEQRRDGYMVKSVQFTILQFGDKKRALQNPQTANGKTIMVDATGLNLSTVEAKVVEAIQVALHHTGYTEDNYYNGHFEVTTTVRTGGYMPVGSTVTVPGLYISEPELLKLACFTRGSNGRFRSRDKKKLREALDSLRTQMRKIYYIRQTGDKQHVVELQTSLIQLTRVRYADSVKAIRSGDARATWYQIVPHHIFVDQMSSFYFLQSIHLIQQIEDAKEKLRGPQRGQPTDHERLFALYLLTRDQDYPILQETLAVKLHLEHLIEQRHMGRLEKAIQQAIDVALQINILLDYKTTTTDAGKIKYHFTTNPEEASRHRKRLEKKLITD